MAQLLMENKEEVDEIVAGVVKVVESDCSISVVSRSSTPLPDEIDEIIVTYWPMRGPAAGAVAVTAAAGGSRTRMWRFPAPP